MKKIIFSSLLVCIGILQAGRVDISGIDKKCLLRELFANAKPKGLGFRQYNPKHSLSDGEATVILRRGYIDYLKGRAMKIDLSDNKVDTSSYNSYNGKNAVEKIIWQLRIKGFILQAIKENNLINVRKFTRLITECCELGPNDFRDEHGNNLLHIAILCRKHELDPEWKMVKELIAAGVYLAAKNKYNQTPLEVLLGTGYDNFFEIIGTLLSDNQNSELNLLAEKSKATSSLDEFSANAHVSDESSSSEKTSNESKKTCKPRLSIFHRRPVIMFAAGVVVGSVGYWLYTKWKGYKESEAKVHWAH